jgi:hypothetical protein
MELRVRYTQQHFQILSSIEKRDSVLGAASIPEAREELLELWLDSWQPSSVVLTFAFRQSSTFLISNQYISPWVFVY